MNNGFQKEQGLKIRSFQKTERLKNALRFLPRLAISTLVFTLVLCSSCSKKEEITEGKINVRFSFVGTASEAEIYKKIFRTFEEKYPHIKIKYEHVTRGYFQKLLTSLAGGSGPDVFFINLLNTRRFIVKGIAENLTPYIKKDETYSTIDFYQKAIDAFTIQGKIYGLPKDIEPGVLFYNKDLFDRNEI